MQHVLYAEIYLICCIVVGLLFLWTAKREAASTPERKLKNVFGVFFLTLTRIESVSDFCIQGL